MIRKSKVKKNVNEEELVEYGRVKRLSDGTFINILPYKKKTEEKIVHKL